MHRPSIQFIGGGLTFLAAVVAHAQDPCDPVYRVIDLGPIDLDGNGFDHVPDDHGTFGISDKGAIVYWVEMNGVTQARLWLPNDAYGLLQGNHNLGSAGSVARDINQHGLAVGQVGGFQSEEGEAALWNLSGPNPLQPILLGTLSGTIDGTQFTSTWSRAFSISDGRDDNLDGILDIWPVITGESSWLGRCDPCDSEEDLIEVLRGFYQELPNLIPQPMDELSPAPIDCVVNPPPTLERSNATRPRDVATLLLPSSEDHLLGGWATRRRIPIICDEQPAECGDELNSTRWYLPSAPALVQPLADPAGTVVLGVNEQGNLVGWGESVVNAPCAQHATFWESAGAMAQDLAGHLYVPAPDSRAEAVANGVDPLVVVGTDLDLDWAVRWVREAGSWDADPLNDLTACNWIIQFAHDVNEGHAIIAHGLKTGGPLHALALFPFDCECPEDIDGDGEVEVDDLLAILSAWGDCPQAAWCFEDVNADCVVDTTDLLALLGAWGDCGIGGGEIPQTIDDCIERFGYEDPIALQKCIDAVTGGGGP